MLQSGKVSEMLYSDTMEVTNMELIRKQTYITPAQARAVKRLAQQQGTTEAEILRKALDLFLAREGIGVNACSQGLPRWIMMTSIADIKRVFMIPPPRLI